jgi:hypothetical protein
MKSTFDIIDLGFLEKYLINFLYQNSKLNVHYTKYVCNKDYCTFKDGILPFSKYTNGKRKNELLTNNGC